MSGKSKIEWTDRVWNPVTGCTKISAGCKNCYAERMSKRLAGRGGYPADDPFKVTLHPDRLEKPRRWKKSSKIFVCSMGDLFHDDVPDEYIKRVYDVIDRLERHTFIVLTKRPQRMYDFYAKWVVKGCRDYFNLWLGVTAENQEEVDARIPLLLAIPAAVRFVSIEPMLGPVDLSRWKCDAGSIPGPQGVGGRTCPICNGDAIKVCLHIDWVICGGESGPGARPMHPDWARSLRDQCKEANVPFFFKQWGEWRLFNKDIHDPLNAVEWELPPITKFLRLGKNRSGRLLDGKEHNEMPGGGK